MSQKLKLSVLFWFYSMVYKPPGLEYKRGISEKRDDLLIQVCLKTRLRLI
jgi:hypothetical protein